MWWFISVIPDSWKVEIRRTEVQANLRKKVREAPISINRSGMLACSYNTSYTGGTDRRIIVRGWLWAKYETNVINN